MFILFVKLGDQQGYIITLAPVLAILLPSFKIKRLNTMLCVVMFSTNLIAINFLNSYPTKIFISHGYWIQSMSLVEKYFGKFKFIIPKKGDFGPIGGDRIDRPSCENEWRQLEDNYNKS